MKSNPALVLEGWVGEGRTSCVQQLELDGFAHPDSASKDQ